MKKMPGVKACSQLIERNFRRLKLVSGCDACEEVRMRPVKAWAVVRNKHLQGKITNGMDVLLVLSTKKDALKYKLTDDRVVRVQIREVGE